MKAKMLKSLLNENEASLELGITKELLFAYTRYAPKSQFKNRKLKSLSLEGQMLFTKEELNNWDDFLKQPWSEPKEKRAAIPDFIKDYLKIECGGKCARCGNGHPLDNAHIEEYATSFSHHHHNLIRICKNCHTKYDEGMIPKEEIQALKQKLINEIKNKITIFSQTKVKYISPPNPNPVFIGRANELQQLRSIIPSTRCIIIQGIGGIGKTQLLLNVIHDYDDMPSIWLNAEDYSSLREFKQALIIAVQPLCSSTLANENLLNHITDLKVRIIIDGIDHVANSDWDDTIVFLSSLVVNTKTPHIIISSQVDFTFLDLEKKAITLKPLNSDNSLQIIKEFSEIDEDDNLVHFQEYCDGHPLSLKLVGAIIRYYGKTDLALEYLKKSKKLIHPRYQNHSKNTSLDVCLLTAYHCFNEEERKFIQHCSSFASGCKLVWFERDWGKLELYNHLARAQQFFFVEIQEDSLGLERVSMLNPVRSFVISKALEDDKEEYIKIRTEAFENISIESVLLSHKYLEAGENYAIGLHRIEVEYKSFLEAFNVCKTAIDYYDKKDPLRAKYLHIIINFGEGLGKFCFIRNFFEQGKHFANAAIDANLELGYHQLAALQFTYLAQIQKRQYNFKGCEETINSLKELAEQSSEIDIKIKYKWLEGSLALEVRDLEKASKSLAKAKALMELNPTNELEKTSTKGNLALITFDIAKVFEFSNNYLKAKDYYTQVIKLQHEIEDYTNLPSTYFHLGNCYSSLKDNRKAIKYYLSSADGFLSIGNAQYFGNVISELGRLSIHDSSISINNPFNEDNLKWVLNSLEIELLGFLVNQSGKEPSFYIPQLLISKTILTIQFLSFSRYAFLLQEWSVGLSNKFYNYPGDMPITPFALTMQLGCAIGFISKSKKKKLTKKTNYALLQSAWFLKRRDFANNFKMFEWLEAWLKHIKIKNNTNLNDLLEEADELFGFF